jgi:hypothetical protein
MSYPVAVASTESPCQFIVEQFQDFLYGGTAVKIDDADLKPLGSVRDSLTGVLWFSR